MSTADKRNPSEFFGINVFNDEVMKERLPIQVYEELKRTIDNGEKLHSATAEVIANEIKEWAVEKGATHFTHWFQPMTGTSAGKHEAFIHPAKGGRVLMEFSGKELIKGESDASSFPSGGLRVTFEARGYTAWDCTSNAFIKGTILYIPTAFCSYTGEALDKKTPLLRSMEAVSKQAVRVLRALGNTTVNRVVPVCGAEQEYFLVDKADYKARIDLQFAGRTLFGAMPPKGQELDDHYYGAIRERILNFMNEVDEKLWELGVAAKTRHKEVAPAQFEIAPIFDTVNIACDHNQLIMETLKEVALEHDFFCLLHEKPFKGINGSGKHNNWSLSTDDGKNLFNPGQLPQENLQFLLFFSAVIKAVDEYEDIIRMSAANAGNDLRLGCSEAPPSIISIFTGEHLELILENIANGITHEKEKKREKLQVGVKTLPQLPKDTSDRNRTSPFAFTGNKFEFRMVPSSASTAGSSFVINTVVAEALMEIADALEKSDDIYDTLIDLVSYIYKKHKKIIYNGNNYCDEWMEEAKRRGLSNADNFADAMLAFVTEKSINVFEKHGVLSRAEVESRFEIMLDTYNKEINIEAHAALEMAKRQFLPSMIEYQGRLAKNINEIRNAGRTPEDTAAYKIFEQVSKLNDRLYHKIYQLEEASKKASNATGTSYEIACIYRDDVCKKLEELREVVDGLEVIANKNYWPVPTYTELLFQEI